MKGHIVDIDNLVVDFPTHLHQPKFWEALGRAVATFGFLEDTIVRAIFALTATTEYDQNSIETAIENWPKVLERCLHDTLGALITSFEKAVRDNQKTENVDLPELVSDLREAAALRNILCHGLWNPPDSKGFSIPRFIDRKSQVNTTPIDIAFLSQTQRAVTELVCDVMNSVTHMGYQFPGSNGPGKEIWSNKK